MLQKNKIKDQTCNFAFFLIGFLFHDLHINEWIEGLKVVSMKLDMINWAEPLNLDLTYI
jgi:hypothetical protein